MIGGFGASSKIDWDVFGGLGYEINQHMSVLAGYRAIGANYEGDELLFDVIQHGPMIGSCSNVSRHVLSSFDSQPIADRLAEVPGKWTCC